jgi:hypothetical protein
MFLLCSTFINTIIETDIYVIVTVNSKILRSFVAYGLQFKIVKNEEKL